jgi:hypothetical protein
MTKIEYHIVFNKSQIMGMSYGIIAMNQSITIDDEKHDLIVLGKKQYKKLLGVKDEQESK